MTTATAPSARELLLSLKFNESDWVRRGDGKFADYIGSGAGGGGGSGGGGSSGGTGGAIVGAADDRIKRRYAFIKEASNADIEALYKIPGVTPKVQYNVTTGSRRGDVPAGRVVVVDLHEGDDGGGRRLGRLERTFGRDGTVHHDIFTVLKSEQGEGLAARINEHAENEYRKLGFTKIELNADIDIGKYAWARQGYDFNDPRDMNQKYHEAYYSMLARDNPNLSRLELTERANAVIPDSVSSISNFTAPLHAWEIASLDDGQEWPYQTSSGKEGKAHLGKALMLGGLGTYGPLYSPDWDGSKSLNPGSDSTKVGDAYYAQKPGTESYQKRIDANERRRRGRR